MYSPIHLHPHVYQVNCRECHGRGRVRGFIDCGKPMSLCCGGCTELVTCEVCEGRGIVFCDCYEIEEFEFQCIDCLNEGLTND